MSAFQCRADVHQGEAEQVLATPLGWVECARVRRPEADTPDDVPGRGLDEHLGTRGQQERTQRWVLRELGDVPADHDVVAGGLPLRLVEVADRTAQLLR